jgi:hypothetical protein
MGMVPSLEEVVLSKCNEGPNTGLGASADDQAKQDWRVFFQCKETVLDDMQQAAFERENDAILTEKCRPFPPLAPEEISTLKALLQKGANATSEEASVRIQLWARADTHKQCKNGQKTELLISALKNWHDEFEASKQATRADLNLRPNPFDQINDQDNPDQTADDFDAKDLSPESMAKRGKEAYEAANYHAALRWFQKAAALGNAEAMMGMSWIYGNGRGVAQNDAEAMRWRKMSAEHGNPVAMSSIAYDYEYGKGVAQDYAEAMRWYKKAADQDDSSAMRSIGYLFEHGHGVTQDYLEARRWYVKAADRGDTLAMYLIGLLYEYGHGVASDHSQARTWMKKAAALGALPANRWLIENP